MIVGLGAVGTWVTQSLLMDGVQNFILIDPDKVEISNLHRQIGFTEKSIGTFKVDAFSEYLKIKSNDVNITKIKDWLDETFFEKYQFSNIDLIINCADFPTVDKTSLLIGEYCMQKGIPHIIGGGYNLHQSLIGQVVIPNKTACVECFREKLEEINRIDTANIRKMEHKNRKIGSFPPLSALSASITANESFKILANLENIVMNNNRTEFLIRTLNFSNIEIKRSATCKWCGNEGKYYQL